MAPLHWVAFITGIYRHHINHWNQTFRKPYISMASFWQSMEWYTKKEVNTLGDFSEFFKFNDLLFPCKKTSGIFYLFHDTVKRLTSNGTTRIQLIWFSSVFCGLKNSKGWKNRRYFLGEVSTTFLRVKKESWIISLVGRVKSRFGGSLKIRRFLYRKWGPLH